MPRTITIPLSDAAIRRHLSNPDVYQLKDDKHPLVVRYNTARTAASWHIVRYHKGKAIWRKIGAWPTLNIKAIKARLPDITVQMAVDPRPDKLRVGQMQTVGQVLAWYLNRALSDSNLSGKRKSTIKTAIKKHLLPRLGLYRLDKIDRKIIDHELLWPLQGDYEISTVRMIFSCMKTALKRAEAIRLIDFDPMAGMKFTDFITQPIQEKEARIRKDQIKPLLKTLRAAPPKLQLLLLMMLMHGTRLSETLKAKWSDINLDTGWWYIPKGNTKTRQRHELPLSPTAIELLRVHKANRKGQYVFPGRVKHWCDSAAGKAIRELSKRKWSAHDLRKAATEAWTKLGVDYLVIKFSLNHALSKVDRHYIQHYADNKMREALTAYHEWLKKQGLTAFVNQDSTKTEKTTD